MEVILNIEGIGALVRSRGKYYACEGVRTDKAGRKRMVRPQHGVKPEAALNSLRDIHRSKNLRSSKGTEEMIEQLEEIERKWQVILETWKNGSGGLTTMPVA